MKAEILNILAVMMHCSNADLVCKAEKELEELKSKFEKVYSKEDLIIEFIESEIQETEIFEENGEFFVTGCLEPHHGSYDEPAYCAVELEAVGETKKEALVNALIEVVNKMKNDIEEEKRWNESEGEL